MRLKDPVLCNELFNEVIGPYLADTLKTRMLLPDGEYVRLHETRRFAHLRNGHRFNAQDFLIEFIEGRLNLDSVPPVPALLSRLRPPPSAAESSE